MLLGSYRSLHKMLNVLPQIGMTSKNKINNQGQSYDLPSDVRRFHGDTPDARPHGNEKWCQNARKSQTWPQKNVESLLFITIYRYYKYFIQHVRVVK
jgi:hypothetical protein